jgi:hypothetical protein
MQNLVREVFLRGMKEVLDRYLLLKMFLREMEEHVLVSVPMVTARILVEVLGRKEEACDRRESPSSSSSSSFLCARCRDEGDPDRRSRFLTMSNETRRVSH